MAELFDEDYFNKRRTTLRKKGNGQRGLFILMVVILVAVVIGVAYWSYKNNPDTVLVNINKASVEQLQYLPEVGPATAKAIIAGRPYSSPEELKNIKGIGEKTFQSMKARVTVE